MAPDSPPDRGGGPPPQAAAAPPGKRILLWAGAVIGVLLAAAAVTAFTRDAALDPETPEGVVQLYLLAMIDGRRGAARAYLSDRLRRECTAASTRHLQDRAYRIEWLDTVFEGSTAFVDVRVTKERPLDRDYSHHRSFVLARQEDGEGWRITHQDWPQRRCSEYLSPPPRPDLREG